MSYHDLRTALGRGFYLDNLWHITRLGFDLHRNGRPTHPDIPFTIATIAEKVARHWSSQPLPNDIAEMVEEHLRPKLVGLIDVAEADSAAVTQAIQDANEAYAELPGDFLDLAGLWQRYRDQLGKEGEGE